MSFLEVLQEPWCFATLLALVVLLFLAAGLVARQQRLAPQVTGFPPERYPAQALAASAPLEALAALQTRLQELHQHLPPGSDDERWMGQFLRRLRMSMDRAYDRLADSDPRQQTILLQRLAPEVAALHGVINMHLGASLGDQTDREALEAQLTALRQIING
ncbi:MAG: hypothetical protein H0X37_17975 [Herpetosiphonaceae bacterium]|nr:hypothetical protein [Herpetosiphonaceae bacterium]